LREKREQQLSRFVFVAMKGMRLTIVVLLAIVSGASTPNARTQSKTYSETRKLLVRMEHTHADANLKKLFEEADARKSDLIQALYDPEQKVTVNAQVVMKYLQEPEYRAH
jgi:hypothetical protein